MAAPPWVAATAGSQSREKPFVRPSGGQSRPDGHGHAGGPVTRRRRERARALGGAREHDHSMARAG